ncbi:MAG TPA: MgtC/SapB family protein [Nitriliruptorales bacterium]
MELEFVIRLLVAGALGAIIGVEREVADQPAGLRTHLTVALGGALFGIISVAGFDEFIAPRAGTNVQVDPTRVASQVVVGVGFLGGAMIVQRRGTVKHLTTGASLWVSVAVGLACGLGMIAEAGLTTLLVLVSLALLKPVREWVRLRAGADRETVRLVVRPGAPPSEVLRTLREIEGLRCESVRYEREDGTDTFVVELRAEPNNDVADRLAALASSCDLVSVSGG